jgi:3-phosphoshikimate 1-carboxyvinyltransferase
MKYQLEMDRKELRGSIDLPASKSVSNRLLILNALAEAPGNLDNLSESDDTMVLQKALATGEGTIDIGHAGTAMRFLTAYLCIREGEYILTGSERMKERPIGKLVSALTGLGADISYLSGTGFPPLAIRGKDLEGGQISVDGSISSQYITALMMIGPSLRKGITICLENDVISSSYIHLTRELMQELGIPVDFSGRRITIPFHPYRGKDMRVEGDWSAASYWYALAVLSDGTDLEIKSLRSQSSQGDSVLPELFRPLGIRTSYTEDGILLSRTKQTLDTFEFDFRDNPDLVQTMAVLCGMISMPFIMWGTRTLKIKETDRILALQNEMKKLGIHIEADPGGEWISWDGDRKPLGAGPVQIKTYEDHRMAMAFSPAALKHPGLIIEDPRVVHKSYPGFWGDLEKVGLRCNELD